MNNMTEYVQGIFKEEIKNRFLCSVEVNGKESICYIPLSCRISNFINMKNCQVLLRPTKNDNTRTEYAVYAIKYKRSYIMVNLAESNKVIEEELSRRFFSFLGRRKHVVHEKKINDYKCDLFIKDTNTLIEIKSILSFEKSAVFPTIYSERAISQLYKICDLLDNGYNACYMLVSLNSSVKEIAINQDKDEYYDIFTKCVKKGMKCCGISLKLQNNIPVVYSKIHIQF